MAPAQSKRQSRKRRKAAAPPHGESAERIRPRPSGGPRRPATDSLATIMTGATYGERPESPFGGLPISEIAIFVGALGAVIGLITAGRAALLVGIAVCTLGVLEVTAREHFSGYRSHATLLAAVPAAAILAVSVAAFGSPHQRATRELLLLAAAPLFGVLFWLLRKRFRAARQARIVRPPAP